MILSAWEILFTLPYLVVMLLAILPSPIPIVLAPRNLRSVIATMDLGPRLLVSSLMEENLAVFLSVALDQNVGLLL